MTGSGGTADRTEPARRAAAVGALVLTAAAVAIAVAGLVGDLARVLVAPALLLAATVTAWVSATRRGTIRIAAAATTLVLVGLAVTVVLTAEGHGLRLGIVLALLAGSTGLVRYALRRDRRALRSQRLPGVEVGPARHGVLIMNPKSGGGRAERFALADECGRRGIEPLVLEPGDDLVEMARRAVERGADVIGMAGGDGSQAVVATVAMDADVPMVCVPAGTRNHFALDLGLDRNDVVAALDAFDTAVERRIDLAEVNGRVFVNNVSLGVYGTIIQSPEYRHAKRQTIAGMLADLLGPGAGPFDLDVVRPDGSHWGGADVIQVSNNPYALTSLAGFGSRARLDTGTLGVAAAEIRGAIDVAAFVAAQTAGRLDRYDGWSHWATDRLTVESGGPVAVGIDGEAIVLEAPLEFRILPGALRVRVPTTAPGYSPAALKAPSLWWTLTALVRAAAGHTTPIEETLR